MVTTAKENNTKISLISQQSPIKSHTKWDCRPITFYEKVTLVGRGTFG